VSIPGNSNSSRSKGKVWIDLDNSPHVPFFAPILEELEHRGYSTVLTARDCFQVCDLADLYHLPYTRVGRHHGKNKALKLGGLCLRAVQLLPFVLRERPNLALSHGSRAQLLCSAATAIPCVSIFDYEFARSLQFLHPNSWAMAPEVISEKSTTLNRERFLTYPGIKEDVYVAGLKADPGIRASLGLSAEDLVVTLRPPAEEAHYHSPKSDELFRAAIEFLGRQAGVRMVLLPRNHKQGVALSHRWPQLFAASKVRIPEHAVDGLNLIWNSDLVISGGGTMNREAAALQVPVYSVFRGKIGAVDRYLAKNGRLVLLESAQDVQTKIRLVRRDISAPPAYGESRALQTIVDHLENILDSNGGSAGARRALVTSSLPSRKHLEEVKEAVPDLMQFAVRGLQQMFDPASGQFCHALRSTGQGFARVGFSPRYTLMTLLGLHHYEAAGAKQPFELDVILNGLLSNTAWIDNLGDLGLLLWTCALLNPGAVEDLCGRLDVRSALSRFPDAGYGTTMHLSWFLTGVSHAALAGVASTELLSSLAFETRRLVANNQGDHGLFGHHTRGANLMERMRARVGAFADQVYPIYAFSRFAQAFGVEEAAKDALRCGSAICRLQGPQGQWWWHYDAVTGKVIGRYPVFSVHQGGMAPMALFVLGQASQADFTSNIYHGLRWIYGANELNCDFRDLDTNLIWRSMYGRRFKRYWRPLAARFGISELAPRPSSLAVLHEARPYEIGWLLYAFASQGSVSQAERDGDLSCSRA
jgi:uncharacterized protein